MTHPARCTAAGLPLAALAVSTALASLPTQALTLNRANVAAQTYVPTLDYKGLSSASDQRDEGAGAVAVGIGMAPLFGARDVVTGFDGRCVVIETGALCKGDEAPLTTQTVLNPGKPLMAQEGTSASADATAFAHDGRVGAKAWSAVSTGLNHATIDPANPGRSTPGKPYSTGSAYTSAFASSQHTNSLLGPAGGVATITLSGVVSGHVFIDSSPGLGNQASYALLVQGSAAPVGQRCNNLLLGCAAQFDMGHRADGGSGIPPVLGNDRRSFAISFQARAGDVVSLYLQANASTYNSGLADASHTLTIDEITLSDGFAFEDGTAFVRNGNSWRFAAAVPEPATWASLLLGLAALGGAARVRRSSLQAS